MTPQETARAILAWYGGDASKWGRNKFATNAAGLSVSTHSEEAVCWCVIGAAKRVGCEDADSVYSAFNAAASRALGLEHRGYVSSWNDAPERTFADVVALLERIAAEPEGAP
jgi:hypothetical protein